MLLWPLGNETAQRIDSPGDILIQRRITRVLFLSGLLATLFPYPVYAEENWGLCNVPSIERLPETNLELEATQLEAQRIRRIGDQEFYLEGSASLSRSYQSITAENIFLDQQSRKLQATGEVIFQDREIRLSSPSIRLDDKSNTGQFESPQFELPTRHARGQADAMSQLDESRSLFTNLVYTSCDPGQRDWHLRAGELLLDDSSGRGSATNTTLYFKEVPFLYLPYFQFPIDDRRMSGLLTPTVGSSESSGLTVIAPIYLNLAPNYDATYTPAAYEERGLQTNIEGRYLVRNNRGTFEYSILDDRSVDDERSFTRLRHNAELPLDVSATLLLAEASDKDFFSDFSVLAPEYEDDNYLERFLRLNQTTGSWKTELLWQDYQTLDESIDFSSRPYQRYPQLSVNGSPEIPLESTDLELHTQWTAFDREQSVTGERLHFSPTISASFSDTWYFLRPELQLNFTDYQLSDGATKEQISRSLPTLSLDSGLIFERFGGDQNQWLQTLEPRLYFLYTPFEDQQDIPDFDTSTRSFNYANLFVNNRFTGFDRIGDAQQVTAGLSTRLFNQQEGRDVLRASAAQIFYAEDREVSLDNSIDTSSASDILMELDYWPLQSTRLGTRLRIDEDSEQAIQQTYSVNYTDYEARAANLEYSFTEDSREQVLLSFAVPLDERWSLQAKTQHSLRFNEVVENIVGLSYESCCWGIKLLLQQEGDASADFAEDESSFFFELTLKGLSQFGSNIDSTLSRSIPGYRPGF